MPGNEGLAGRLARLLRRWGAPSPAATRKGAATPEEAVQAHFAAVEAHDLESLLATLAPERARLYNDPRTLDKRRLTVVEARILGIVTAGEEVPLPAFAHRYGENVLLKVEYELRLVEQEARRDPTLREGRQWSYFALVREVPGKPWLIADWGC